MTAIKHYYTVMAEGERGKREVREGGGGDEEKEKRRGEGGSRGRVGRGRRGGETERGVGEKKSY